ncbi:MAG: protein kinase [Blastocatellia bacterium]
MDSQLQDLILKQAIEKGLLLAEDCCLEESNETIKLSSEHVEKWGGRIARLLELGLISEEALDLLAKDIDLAQETKIISTRKTQEIKEEENFTSGELKNFNDKTLSTAVTLVNLNEDNLRTEKNIHQQVTIIKPTGSSNSKPKPTASLFTTDKLSEEALLKGWERYKDLKLIGVGGMGKVFRAVDPKLNRIVALKFLVEDEADLVIRFIREARLQARIEHENICKIYEIGEFQGRHYIAMQYINGISLDRAKETLSVEQKVKIIKDVSEALHTAHKQGLIHRDIKPSNILVENTDDKGWSPCIVDFGLAREVGDINGTGAGVILGTPSYMSPEQGKGRTHLLDRRTDVYSLGVTLYELLGEELPFKGKNYFDVILRITQDTPTPLKEINDAIAEDLNIIVMKCLEKDPQLRYSSAKALATDLQLYLNGEAITARTSKTYRLKKFIKKHKAKVTMLSLVALLVMFSTGMWIRTSWLAKEQERITQVFGQEVKEIEQVLHYSNSLPLYNTQAARGLIEKRIKTINEKIESEGQLAKGPGYYALGCGYLALQDYEMARLYLEKSWENDYKKPDNAYVLGYVLAELYQRLRSEVKFIANKEAQERRLAELKALYCDPAIKYLKIGSEGSVNRLYTEGLIAFYQDQFDVALAKSKDAFTELPWLYDAKRLEGRIYQQMAVGKLKNGDYKSATLDLELAKQAFQQAIDIARSDAGLYELEAERNLKLMEIMFDTGESPETASEQALAACDKALIVNPESSSTHITKAKIHYTLGLYQIRLGQDPVAFDKTIVMAQKAIDLNEQKAKSQKTSLTGELAGIPYAYLGAAYYRKASQEMTLGQDPRPTLEKALATYNTALKQNLFYYFIYKNLGDIYWQKGRYEFSIGLDAINSLNSSIENHQKAISLNKTDLFNHNALGNTYEIRGEYDLFCGANPEKWLSLAVEAYQKAIAINPNHPYPHNNIGISFRTKARYELAAGLDPTESVKKSVESFEKGLKLGPFADGYRFLSEAWLVAAEYSINQSIDATESLKNARLACEEGINRNKNNPELYLRLAEVDTLTARNLIIKNLSPKDSFQQAKNNFQKALELNNESAEIYLKLAECFYHEISWKKEKKENITLEVQKAIELLTKAEQFNDKLLEAKALKSVVLSLKAEFDISKETILLESKTLLDEALEKNPLLKYKYQTLIKSKSSS